MKQCLSPLIVFLLIWTSSFADSSDANKAQSAKFKIATKRKDDSIEIRVDKRKTMFVIKSPFGISQAVIERAGEKWPDTVALHLHVKGLERFEASNGKVKLAAAVSSQVGKVKVRVWKNGKENSPLNENSPFWMVIRMVGGNGKPAKVLPLKDGYFGMTLPKKLFQGNPRSITLSWIDFYR